MKLRRNEYCPIRRSRFCCGREQIREERRLMRLGVRRVEDPHHPRGYTFGRVSAVVGVKRGDYRLEGKRARLGLMEKGGKEKPVWLHREAEEFLDAYIKEAGVADADAPLFQSLDKAHRLTGEGITRRDMLDVVKIRCKTAGLSQEFCNHTFRGTGITVFLNNDESLE